MPQHLDTLMKPERFGDHAIAGVWSTVSPGLHVKLVLTDPLPG